jgi:hypothetical protein
MSMPTAPITVYVVLERDTRVFGWAYLSADRAGEVAAEQTDADKVWVVLPVSMPQPIPPAPGTV